MIEVICKNGYRLLHINYFRKKTLAQMFDSGSKYTFHMDIS